jgi:hypothetical protein
MKKNTLSSLVVALLLSVSAVSAKADSTSYVFGGVGSGAEVFGGTAVTGVAFEGVANTISFNGGTHLQTEGGTSNSVSGLLGNTDGVAQGVAAANQTGNSADVTAASMSGSSVNVIWGGGSSVSGANAYGSAWHP